MQTQIIENLFNFKNCATYKEQFCVEVQFASVVVYRLPWHDAGK
jgi:hypothetical protein